MEVFIASEDLLIIMVAKLDGLVKSSICVVSDTTPGISNFSRVHLGHSMTYYEIINVAAGEKNLITPETQLKGN